LWRREAPTASSSIPRHRPGARGITLSAAQARPGDAISGERNARRSWHRDFGRNAKGCNLKPRCKAIPHRCIIRWWQACWKRRGRCAACVIPRAVDFPATLNEIAAMLRVGMELKKLPSRFGKRCVALVRCWVSSRSMLRMRGNWWRLLRRTPPRQLCGRCRSPLAKTRASSGPVDLRASAHGVMRSHSAHAHR